VRETKVLLALTSILVIMACLSEPQTTAPVSAPATALLTDAETQPWSALSDYLLN
jgi:hypothetical protein